MREVTFDTNILGNIDRLLNSVLQLKLNPIIHICSSSEIFGKVKKDLPIKETNSFHPASPLCNFKNRNRLIR